MLLDTHVLLWAVADRSRLGAPVQTAILDGRNDVVVSAATVWEIGVKRASGMLSAPDDLPAVVVDSGFQLLSITAQHASLAASLPRHHLDPFDRMLIAQALVEGLTLVTRDPAIGRYEVPTFRA